MDLIYLIAPFAPNITYNAGLPRVSGRDRMPGRTAACGREKVLETLVSIALAATYTVLKRTNEQ